ncbi:MAG TPA: MGMT family protein [Solirubrobacteraceae bacterium]|nr:MGMT family protein [Solirubrobacteraceae bacterium]
MTGRGDPEAVRALVRGIPEGFVVAYGDLTPGAPRLAGQILARTPPGALPWWRVVRADGRLAKGAEQARRLAAEGVPLRNGRVDMAAARLPREALRALAAPTHIAPAVRPPGPGPAAHPGGASGPTDPR